MSFSPKVKRKEKSVNYFNITVYKFKNNFPKNGTECNNQYKPR